MYQKNDKKLVISIASSALFDLRESDKKFCEGLDIYRKYQQDNLDVTLGKGVAFSFIKGLLRVNEAFPESRPVEVILLSRNDLDTGRRISRSIKSYKLDISMGGFFSGADPVRWICPYDASLFLSANEADVRRAIKAGLAAGKVMAKNLHDDKDLQEVLVAFDFDGIVVDDEAEQIFRQQKVEGFEKYEIEKSGEVMNPGPLKKFISQVMYIRSLELARERENPDYRRILKTALVTSRSMITDERVFVTLKSLGIDMDYSFFLAGKPKKEILEELQPQLYFDDQALHLANVQNVPLVHVPFGKVNEEIEKIE